MSKTKIQPKIRFKNFDNSWEKPKFKLFISKAGKKNSANNDFPAYSVSNKVGLIPQNEQFEGGRLDFLEKTSYKIVNPKEFAYNPARINVGSIGFNDLGFPVLVSSLYVVVKMSEVLNNDYVLQYIKSPEFIKEVKRNTEGSVREYLFFESLKNVKLPYTELIAEQIQIASFFKKLDEMIDLQQQCLDDYKQLKKAMLQNMFPKNNDKIPKIRFDEYTDTWEQRKLLDNMCDVLDFRGKSPIKIGMEWGNSGYLVLSALNVKDGYIDKEIEAKYGSQQLFEKWMGNRRLEKGDVVFTTEAPLGNVAQIPDNKGYILNQRAVAFKVEPKKMDKNFLAQLLRSPLFQSRLQANASGGTAKGIGMKKFAKMTSKMPKNIEEQQKIGTFFKQLDNAIALHQRKLDSYKKFKKAMLQRMFI